jgi:threo-3-hydroxy-L-aspartate ammonia-lyase
MPLVSLDEVREAAALLRGEAEPTPLLRADWLSEEVGAEVRLKAESLQRSGSFKFRGAYHYLARLAPEVRARGVITYSSGNHAQAVALAARQFGVPAVVVMPTTAPGVKRKGAEALGAEVVLVGTTSIERREAAEARAARDGLHMVPPFDHPWIIAGQGTAALEALERWPEMDTWVVCVGGGGLASGSAVALRGARGRGIRIIGVEPEGANAMEASLRAGAPVTLPGVNTIADGLAPVRPGDLTFEHVRTLVDDLVTVTDDEIRASTRDLLLKSRLVVEFSGAAAVAAVRSGRVALAGARVGAILSGGNIDPARVAELAAG